MNKPLLLLFMIVAVITVSASEKPRTSGAVPSHPSKLHYDSLAWEVPLGAPYREELPNGCITYIAKDSLLPLVKMTIYLRYGSLADPKGKEGLSSLFATMMRTGGTKKYPADTLDEIIDQHAFSFGFSAGESHYTFSASFLSDYTDKALAIIREMLYFPVFDSVKLEKERNIMIESIRHRFDNPGPTLGIAFEKQFYAGQIAGAVATEASVKNITRKDLVALHAAIMSPVNMLLCASGSFDRDTMKKKFVTMLAQDKPPLLAPLLPKVSISCKVKTLVVHKPLSQAYVRLGLPFVQRPHPDFYAMSLLNEILGGGGFTSRLGEKVRSDAGLTYSIYSVAESNYTYPGTIFINFFTKNETFAQAVTLSIAEVRKLVAEGVTDQELADAKSSVLGELPSMFRSADDIVSTYGWNEYYHRSPDHFRVYPQKINEITKADLARVAKQYIVPDSLTVTVVGDTTALLQQKSEDFALVKRQPKVILPEAIPALP